MNLYEPICTKREMQLPLRKKMVLMSPIHIEIMQLFLWLEVGVWSRRRDESWGLQPSASDSIMFVFPKTQSVSVWYTEHRRWRDHFLAAFQCVFLQCEGFPWVFLLFPFCNYCPTRGALAGPEFLSPSHFLLFCHWDHIFIFNKAHGIPLGICLFT